MLAELTRERFEAVRHLFDALAFNTEIPSILDGNTNGRIFVDDTDNPAVAVIWDGIVGLFLAGSPDCADFNGSLPAWFAADPIPVAQAYGIEDLTLAYTPEVWATQLPRLLSSYRLTLESRRAHIHAGTPVMPPELDPRYTVVPVTPDLLQCDDLEGRDWLEGWILSYWPSLVMYFEKGIGRVALADGDTIASLCVSVFAGDRRLEFGTATHPDHRNRGLSTAVAATCINVCLDRGIAPIWHCWAANAPSIAVAHKVGFTLERETTVYKLWVPAKQA